MVALDLVEAEVLIHIGVGLMGRGRRSDNSNNRREGPGFSGPRYAISLRRWLAGLPRAANLPVELQRKLDFARIVLKIARGSDLAKRARIFKIQSARRGGDAIP